ncbi:hypothetical protein ACV22V_30590 [Burkholderia sp. AW33-5]
MFTELTLSYEHLLRHVEREIQAWMTRVERDDLPKRDRVQCCERAIGALLLWSSLTTPRVNALSLAIRAAHTAAVARLFECVGMPEQAARLRAAPFAQLRVPLIGAGHA